MNTGEIVGVSLEQAVRMVMEEQRSRQLPEGLLHGICRQCGLRVHPANNLYLISDLVEGSTTCYADGLAHHFVPMVIHGVRMCPGAPGFYRLLDGVRVQGYWRQGEDGVAAREAWRYAFQQVMEYATKETSCFAFLYKGGIWQQEYTCRLFMRGMGGLRQTR